MAEDLPIPPIPPDQMDALNDPAAQINYVYNPQLSIVVLNAAMGAPDPIPASVRAQAARDATQAGTGPVVDDSPTAANPNTGEIPFAISAEVTNNNWYAADRFSAEFALWADPRYGPDWWDQQDELLLDIRFAVGAGAFTSMLIGRVDHIDIDWTRGLVRIDGRDLTSNFLDHRMYGAFQNKTSSQIAKELAANYGMKTDIDETTGPVSRFYEQEHEHIEKGEFTRSISEWDMLTYLAQHEGSDYNVWVSGTTLHFKKSQDINEAKPWVLNVGARDYEHGVTRLMAANMATIKMTRAMTLAKDVIVVVRSWNSQQKQAYNVFSPKGAASSTGKNPGQKHVYTFPNLTKDKAQHKADAIREELSKHERLIEWTDAAGYPGILALTPRDFLELTGTASGWDMRYHISSITRTVSDSGLSVRVQAKNHTTKSDVQSV